MAKDTSEKFKLFASKHNYSWRLRGAETHWYFIEGAHAFEEGLYLASLLSFFNGIESSIRTILMYVDSGFDNENLSGKVLSNGLLLDAERIGLNIQCLAFPEESEFKSKLGHKKPPVEIVRNRNNLCHGNVFEFISVVPETGEKIFTPECLKVLAKNVKEISENWSCEIDRFKKLQIEI